MLCAVVLFCCQTILCQHCTSVLAITVVQACLSCNDSLSNNTPIRQLSPLFLSDNCINTSTLTFVALRQLHQYVNSHLHYSQTIAVPCSLNCLVLSIHNPARSVALRRRLPFLQKLITVTCERFSTQQLSEPNHKSNCVGPA